MAEEFIADILDEVEKLEGREKNQDSDLNDNANLLDTTNAFTPSQARYVVNMREEKQRFIKIIKKLKTRRNRPSFENILKFSQRENPMLLMEDCKIIIDKLEEDGIIYNDSKEPNLESFRVVNVDSIS